MRAERGHLYKGICLLIFLLLYYCIAGTLHTNNLKRTHCQRNLKIGGTRSCQTEGTTYQTDRDRLHWRTHYQGGYYEPLQ